MLNTSIIKCLNQSNLRLLLGASKVKISSGYVIEFSAVGTDQVTEEVSTTDRRLKKKKDVQLEEGGAVGTGGWCQVVGGFATGPDTT